MCRKIGNCLEYISSPHSHLQLHSTNTHCLLPPRLCAQKAISTGLILIVDDQILNSFLVASNIPLLDTPDLMHPALTVTHGDVVEATNTEVFSSDGDVGTTRLGTLVGCGRRVSK